jgi:hypothetical protein
LMRLIVNLGACVQLNGLSGEQERRPRAQKRMILRAMRPMVFAALCMLGVLPVAVDAQVVAAPSSANHQPVVGVTANGIPLVDISTPNGAGVSNNNFTQYDVSRITKSDIFILISLK